MNRGPAPAPYLNTLRIRYMLNGCYDADIDKWIEFALSKKIQISELGIELLYCWTFRCGKWLQIPWRFFFSLSTHDYHTSLKSLNLELEALYVEGSIIC